MNWSIEYYSPKLEKEILKLPDGLLARYLHLTDLMLEFGSNLGMPHTKPIDEGLFELRVKGKVTVHGLWPPNSKTSLIVEKYFVANLTQRANLLYR